MRTVLFSVVAAWYFLSPVVVLGQTKKVDPSEVFNPPKEPKSAAGEEPEKPSANTPIAGKTIDEWILEIHSKDPSKAENAIRSVLLFGPELAQRAAPSIIKELRNKYEDLSIRINGVNALGEILAEDNNADPKAVQAGVSVLISKLRDTDAVVRYRAAIALGKIGPAAAAAIPQLKTTLADRASWELRQVSAHALARIAYDKKKGAPFHVLNALYRALGDPAFQVRLAAIQGFVYLGAPPDPIEQKRVETGLTFVTKNDAEPTVRIWAHMAMMTLKGKVDPDRMKIISSHLKDKDVYTRTQAAQALWSCGLEAKTEVMELVAALKDEEKSVVTWSVMALSRMGRHAEPAMPALKEIVEDEEFPDTVRFVAQQTLKRIQGKAVEEKDDKSTQ